MGAGLLMLDALLERYLDQLRARQYAARTVEGYGDVLAQFIDWCVERSLLHGHDVSRSHVERYQRYLFRYRQKNGQALSLQSQYSRLVAMRGFFRWLYRENHILFDPTVDLVLPRMGQRLPHVVMSAEETERVLSQADVSRPTGIRDRAIMEMLYSTGLRASELARLKLYDVDSRAQTVLVRGGKGNKDRLVPIGERALFWVEKYLDEVRPGMAGRTDEGYLFISNRKSVLTQSQLTGIVHRYVVATGKSGSCHIFRHTMATLMLENGADIRYIQAMLGHSKLTSTQVYTHVAIGKLKEVHTATHPGALLRRAKGTAP